MRLSRKQSFRLAIGVLVGFFIVLAIFFKQQEHIAVSRQTTPESIAEQATLGPTPAQAEARGHLGPQFVLKNFERSETRDGKKVWEVKAVRGQYFPETQSAEVHEATVWFYKENGDITELRAGKALLKLQGPSLNRADTSEGVTLIYNNGVTVETEQALYERDKELVTAPGAVKIMGDLLEVTGESMTVNLKTKEVFLAHNVHSTVKPKQRSHES